MSETSTPAEEELLALFERMDEPVQAAFLEAVQWFAQLPPDQARPGMGEFEELIRSIVERNLARRNGAIN